MLQQLSDPESTANLHALFEAITPYMEAAAQTQRSEPEQVSVLLRAGDPMTVEIVHFSADGESRTWLGLVTGSCGDAVAAALGEFLQAGLNRQQPDEWRHKIAGQLDAGAEMSAVLDPLFRSATGRITVRGHAPRDLFVLQAGDIN